MANVSLSVDNTRCAATYVVNATQDSVTVRGQSSLSPVVVNVLDVCRHSYSVMGHVITAIVTFPEIRVHSGGHRCHCSVLLEQDKEKYCVEFCNKVKQNRSMK